MIKVSTLLLCLFSIPFVWSQQDKQLTHFVFDKMSFNPAATGFNGICGTLIYRNQWDQVQDAPNTTLVNVEANIPGNNLGLGISFTNDVIGFQKNNSLNLNGAYHLRTSSGILSGGIGLGFFNMSFDPDWIAPETLEDPQIPGALSSTVFDLNAGLYWSGSTIPYYLGISTTHLLPTDFKNFNFELARHYYIMGGYEYAMDLRRPVYLKPGFLVKSDGATSIVDFNLLAECWLTTSSFTWIGSTFRTKDAFALSAGYAFSPASIASVNMLKFGYSFDWMLNEMRPFGKGSHELMVNFCMFPPPKPIARSGNPFVLM